MQIADILKNSDYGLELLTPYINDLQIIEKEQKNGSAPYVKCLVRKKDISNDKK